MLREGGFLAPGGARTGLRAQGLRALARSLAPLSSFPTWPAFPVAGLLVPGVRRCRDGARVEALGGLRRRKVQAGACTPQRACPGEMRETHLRFATRGHVAGPWEPLGTMVAAEQIGRSAQPDEGAGVGPPPALAPVGGGLAEWQPRGAGGKRGPCKHDHAWQPTRGSGRGIGG